MLCWIIAIFMGFVSTGSNLTFYEAMACMGVAGLFAIAGNISLH